MKSRFVFLFLVMVLTYGCGVSGGGSGDGGNGTGSGDTISPSVLATAPCECGANIVTDATVSALFSEPLQPSSLNDSTFAVKNAFKNISGIISYSGTVATFKPFSNFSSNTRYHVTISGVKDIAGNSMHVPMQWEFHTGTATSTPGAKFTDIQGIFDSKCISCHRSGGASSFLPLTNDVSYQNIVVKHSNYTTGDLVRFGKAQESILYQRISGTVAGAQMPKGLPELSQAEKDSIEDWINEGALNN